MATKIDTKKLLDVDSLANGTKEIKVNEYQGLFSATGKTTDELRALTHVVDGDNLVITVSAEPEKKVKVLDYFKANGKSKFNLLVGNDYQTQNYAAYDMLANGWVTNPTSYTSANVKKQSFTTTVFNDTVDLTGFQAEDAKAGYYIKKGFNVKTDKGNDTITGSVLNDTITAGAGSNTINSVATDFGDDVINLTKNEALNVTAATDGTGYAYGIEKNDVVAKDYVKTHLGYAKTTEVAAGETHNKVYTKEEVAGANAKTNVIQIVNVTASEGNITAAQYIAANGTPTNAEAGLIESLNNVTGHAYATGTEYRLVGNETAVTSIIESSNNFEEDLTMGAYYHSTDKTYEWNQAGSSWDLLLTAHLYDANDPIDSSEEVTATLETHEVDVVLGKDGKPTDATAAYYTKSITTYLYNGENWETTQYGEVEYEAVTAAQPEAVTYSKVYYTGLAADPTTYDVELLKEVPATPTAPTDLQVNEVEGALLGSLTFKNYASSDAATVTVDEADLGDLLGKTEVTLTDKVKKVTASNRFGYDVTADASTDKNALTVDLSKTQYENDVDLSLSKGKVTVKGGSDADNVTDGQGNGTYTLGKGDNSLTNAGLGKDVVNLTKDEDLAVTLANAALDYKVVKNDVVIVTGVDANGDVTDSVTFKNFAAKDVVGEYGSVKVGGDALDEHDFLTTWSDAEDPEVTEGTVLTSKTKSFTGSRLNDVVDASDFTLYKKGEAIEREDDTYKTTLKGVTVNAKDGTNSLVAGSIYADTYKGGTGVDSVTASFGNDTYTLGTGANVATYNLAVNNDVDTYNLTKGETLTFNGLAHVTGEGPYELVDDVTYSKVGNDIVATKQTGDVINTQIVLKNLASAKTNATVIIEDGDEDHVTAENIWDKDINIKATSAKTTGTFGNDVIVSDRASNTFVESYTDTNEYGIGGTNTIVSKGTKDNIQISALDKNTDKLSAYDDVTNFTYDDVDDKKALTITTDEGNIVYRHKTGDAFDNVDLANVTFTDATNTKWSFTYDVKDTPAGTYKASDKTNNIVWTNSTAVTDGKKNDIIMAVASDQTFNYTAGKDLYRSEVANSDDIYNVAFGNKTSLVVSDTTFEDGNVLNLQTSKALEVAGTNPTYNYSLFFNVDANGLVDGDLTILSAAGKGKVNAKTAKALANGEFVSGAVVLDNAVDDENGLVGYTVNNKVGTAAAVEMSIDARMDEIAGLVASWLGNHTDYTSAFDAIENGTSKEIAELMNVYTTGTYTPSNPTP